MTELKINGPRLWSRLMEMAEIGATEKGGVRRLALTDLDRQGRDLFRKWCENAGCTIEIDSMGNMFARRPGERSNRDPIAAGSHLDTQPTGGKFDGILGVLAALEVIETLNDNDIRTSAPVEAVVWTNEEGARFQPAMIGSGTYAGEFDLEYSYSRLDDEGTTLQSALKAISYLGDTPCGQHSLGAHLELHIEQGPVLEAENLDIGVVIGVQGICWYEVEISGAECHAGPTPMPLRRDPVRRMAGLLNDLYAMTEAHGPDARCTIGRIDTSPGSINTVPGNIKLTIDLRHPSSDILREMENQLKALSHQASAGCEVHLSRIWKSEPVGFNSECIESIDHAASQFRYKKKQMTSGAGHDSVYISRCAPTGMIFVPCKEGISHNELESVTPDQIEKGANVLLHTVLNLAEPF